MKAYILNLILKLALIAAVLFLGIRIHRDALIVTDNPIELSRLKNEVERLTNETRRLTNETDRLKVELERLKLHKRTGEQ